MPGVSVVLEAVEWLRLQGAWTLPLSFMLFVVSNVALVPAGLLTVGLGFVYGFGPGFFVAWLARPSAGVVACVLCRTVLRGRVQAWADQRPLVAALDRALSGGGVRVIMLLRLSPLISSTLVNWLLGLTRVRLRDFALGSALGVLPGTLVYAYIGSGLKQASEIVAEHDAQPHQRALFWLGLLATLAVVFVISRLARRELLRELESTRAAAISARQ
jgi:uncharacterized membrane protein YdjX (TVP38/TMEM64 family)